MTEWDAVKRKIWDRDSGLCLKCHLPATDCHHRKPRKMGGTRNAATVYGLANLVSLCRGCHDQVHGHPDDSYAAGWLVREGENPASVLIELGCGRQLELCDDGSCCETGGCDLFLTFSRNYFC